MTWQTRHSAAYVQALWDEIVPAVPAPPGVDLRRLRGNAVGPVRQPGDPPPHLADRHGQLTEAAAAAASYRSASAWPRRPAVPCLALAVAAWLRCLDGTDEAGKPIEVRDPLAAPLRATLEGAGPDPTSRVAAVLGIEAVFGADLPRCCVCGRCCASLRRLADAGHARRAGPRRARLNPSHFK